MESTLWTSKLVRQALNRTVSIVSFSLLEPFARNFLKSKVLTALSHCAVPSMSNKSLAVNLREMRLLIGELQ